MAGTHAMLPVPARPLAWLALASGVALAAAGVLQMRRVRTTGALVRASHRYESEPEAAVASLLVVGDSTGVGVGATDPLRSVAGMIGHGNQGLRVVNRAVEGARFEDFARQLQQDGEAFDAVLVLGGGNDVIRWPGMRALQHQVLRVAELARERAPLVVLMPCGNAGHAPFFPPPLSWLMSRRSRGLHAAVRAAAAATGARYVNLYRPCREDPFVRRAGELHARDGLHPSDAGYRLWMQELDRQAALRVQLGRIAQKAELGPHATGRPA